MINDPERILTCHNCGKSGTPDTFYRKAKTTGQCKLCRAERKAATSSRIVEYNRQYYKTNKTSIVAKRAVHACENPLKNKARMILNTARRLGTILIEPCKYCISEGNINLEVEGHHSDYSFPLDVTWLCKPHHAKIHLMEGAL